MDRLLQVAVVAVLVVSLVAGCGSNANQTFMKIGASVGEAPAAQAAKEAAGGKPPAGGDAAVKAAATPVERKIIYTGTLDLVVANMDEALPQVEKLVAAQKGYIAKSEVKEDTGRRRTATFSLRVPVDSFPGAREGLLALGTAERNAVDSQDVTEEFVDVQARIKNLKEQEDKLNELLKEKRKEEKLEDIIKVSDRIAEVRRDVERVQGRLNYLANMTAMATINLTLREIKDYKPVTAPTFRNRINSTFENSWEGLVSFGEGLVLLGVGITPWLTVLVPLGIVGFFGLRRTVRSSRKPALTAPTPTSAAPNPPV